MEDPLSVQKRVLHLREVEKLTLRQIASYLKMGRDRIARIVHGTNPTPVHKPLILESYRGLIQEWYAQYPRLKVFQIFERLKSYGYQGSYPTLVRFVRPLRPQSQKAYHSLEFVPAQEAQIDWFFFKHPVLGILAGFLYVLSYSRYAWGLFYPRHSFEFFVDGHIRCFEHLGGLAHEHRYDNLKSVVLSREPMQYNPQFMDFARFYGFSIHLCNPYRGNEKGRVERIIRDIRNFLYGESFESLADLNHKFHLWLSGRNETVHRTTGITPKELLKKERLVGLPQGTYPPTRTIPVLVSKTSYVEFETNRYSVPTSCVSKKALLVAHPEKLEIQIDHKTVARHPRSFARRAIIENPLHFETLLNRSAAFKFERIASLVRKMNRAFDVFLSHQESESQAQAAAYQLFKLLKSHSRALLESAVREVNVMGAFKMKTVLSLLHIPEDRSSEPVYPQNTTLLNIQYEPRSLIDYDQPS